jgi:hypothetical protein
MKRWKLARMASMAVTATTAAALLGGCCLFRQDKPVSAAPVPVKAMPQQLVGPDGVPIERVPFRAGVSSVTVENLAKKQGCVGGQGAGLLSEPGPVEVYRMMCDNGKVFQARCELRQCRQM